MAFRDLREFIKLLDERGELIRVRAPVDPELEITGRVSKGPAGQNKALLFEGGIKRRKNWKGVCHRDVRKACNVSTIVEEHTT